jgi:hypothetical protein
MWPWQGPLSPVSVTVHGRPQPRPGSSRDAADGFRLQPYIRTFAVARWPLSLMGSAGWLPSAFSHLLVLGHCRGSSATV